MPRRAEVGKIGERRSFHDPDSLDPHRHAVWYLQLGQLPATNPHFSQI